MKLRFLFTLLLLLLSAITTLAQNKRTTVVTDTTTRSYRVYKKAIEHYFGNEPAAAKAYAKESIGHANTEKNPEQKVMSLNILGLLHRGLSEYDSAIAVFDESIRIADSLGNFYMLGNAVNNRAMVYYFKGDYETANKIIVTILDRCKKEGDNQLLAISYSNLGNINKEQGRYEDALEKYRFSAVYYDSIGDMQGKSSVINNQGIIYFENIKQYDTAITLFKSAIQIKESIGDIRGTTPIYCNLASIYLEKEQYEESEQYARKALLLVKEQNDNFGKAFLDNYFAELYYKTKKYAQAKPFALKALEQSKKNQTKKETVKILEQLSRIEFELSNYKSGYNYLQEAFMLRDSVLNEANFDKMVELEKRYETQQKEKQILAQRAAIAEAHFQMGRKNLLIAVAVFLLVASLLLGYIFFYRQKQKAKRLEEENRLKDAYAEIEMQRQLHGERHKISRELHDNIGAQLTFITSSLDNIKYLFKNESIELHNRIDSISGFVRQTSAQLRDTVWAMNKGTITFEDMRSRLSDFISSTSYSVEGILFDFMVDEKLTDSKFSFSSLEGIHLYRVIQEAVQNAVKHSGAGKIALSIHLSADAQYKLQIYISDNGKGFEPSSAHSGNGLSNMKNRMKEIGGNIYIDSGEKGSTIKIVV